MGKRITRPEEVTNQERKGRGATAEHYPASGRQPPKATRGEDNPGEPFTTSTKRFVQKD